MARASGWVPWLTLSPPPDCAGRRRAIDKTQPAVDPLRRTNSQSTVLAQSA